MANCETSQCQPQGIVTEGGIYSVDGALANHDVVGWVLSAAR